MEKWLKQDQRAAASAQADAKPRHTVEHILGDVARREDAAVRELCVRFDQRDREDYRLMPAEIENCLAGPAEFQRYQGHQVRPGSGARFRNSASPAEQVRMPNNR